MLNWCKITPDIFFDNKIKPDFGLE